MHGTLVHGPLSRYFTTVYEPQASSAKVVPQPRHTTVKVCSTPQIGFMQYPSNSKRTFQGTETVPEVFSSETGDLGVIGYDVDVIERSIGKALSWDYELYIYASYDAAFYATRIGLCDVAISPMLATPQRMQCFATPPPGTSWGNATG